LHALTDGNTYLMFPAAQDHKTIGEGHTGPMMVYGYRVAITGHKWRTCGEYGERIVDPLLRGLQARGINYKGLVYPGLKLQDGQPKVLEYNARFGDPETQVYARLAESGFLDALLATREGTLDKVDLRWRDMAAVCVVLASAGYPESSQKGVPIDGIDDANGLEGVQVFHAGTARRDGRVVTNGGRVLNVTALGRRSRSSIEGLRGDIPNNVFWICISQRHWLASSRGTTSAVTLSTRPPFVTTRPSLLAVPA